MFIVYVIVDSYFKGTSFVLWKIYVYTLDSLNLPLFLNHFLIYGRQGG